MAVVTIRRLWKEYREQVILENLNLTIAEGEFVTIVGASGCGKTTFLRMLLGVDRPSRGEILIDGTPMTYEPAPDRGIVFQRYSLFPHLTVQQNLLLGLELSGSRVLGRLFGAARKQALEKANTLLSTREVSGAALRRYAAALIDRAVGHLSAKDIAAR
jgi:NitT/TauT family transport system ATP-binding protein